MARLEDIKEHGSCACGWVVFKAEVSVHLGLVNLPISVNNLEDGSSIVDIDLDKLKAFIKARIEMENPLVNSWKCASCGGF